MNSPVRSLDKPKNHAAWLRFLVKQNWQQLVFYTIVLLLVCVLPAIIGTAEELELISRGFYGLTPAQRGGELFRTICILYAVSSCVLGVFAGMASTGYVNSRRAIHCYHSLPLTRDALYLEGAAQQGIYYLASSVLSMLISTLVIALPLGITGEYLADGIWLILAGIGGYLVVFTLFQLSGTLTGTAVFRFIMAGIIAFLPVVLYGLLYYGVASGMQNLNVDKYTNPVVIRWICPAFNIFCAMAGVVDVGYVFWRPDLTGSWHTALDILSLIATAALYFGIGFFVNRKRRSELSETSVIWKKLQLAVKYPVIFVCGAGGAVLFQAMFGSGMSWTIFGCLCGLILSFLLMNVLISKNTKSMFKGLRGLGITALFTAMFLAAVPFDVFGINNFMYDTDQVESVTLYVDDFEVEITDPAEIAEIMPHIIALSGGETNQHGMTPEESQRILYDTAYYIDEDKVLNQVGVDARAQLSKAYPDRSIEVGKFVWRCGDQFVQAVNDGVIYYDAEGYAYAEETTAAVISSETKPMPADGTYAGDYSFNFHHFDISVYPKFGLPVHRYIRVGEISEHAAMLDAVIKSDSCIETYTSLADLTADDLTYLRVDLLGERVNLLTNGFVQNGNSVEEWEWTEEMRAFMNRYDGMLEVLLDAAAKVTPEDTRTAAIGNLTLETETAWVSYPLYAGMTEFWDAWLTFWEQVPELTETRIQGGRVSFSTQMSEYYDLLRYTDYELYDSGAEIMDWVSSFHVNTYIVEADTGRALLVEGDRVAEVLENSMICYNASVYGRADTRYMIVTSWFEGYDISNGLTEDFSYAYQAAPFFRAGQVPQFVLDAFAQ